MVLELIMKIYLTVMGVVLGAVMGSFLNCWAQRYAAGEKVPRGRSRCPDCGHVLTAAELVPIFSWLFQRGRCKSCKKPISVRYPVTELIGAAAFGCAVWRFGLSFVTLEVLLLFGCLMLLAFIDFDTMLLPNGPMLVALAGWVVFLPAHEDIRARAVQGLLTAVTVGGAILLISLIMDKVLGRESMGGGDIKLFALVGLYLGPWKTLLMVLLSCFVGLIFVIVLKARHRAFPFGPAICIATALTVLYGDPIVNWYLGLL